MKTLQIEEKKALEIYKSASNEFKAILESTFGKEFFSQKIPDRVKSYEDACALTGENPVNEKKMLELGFTEDELHFRIIKTITKALNEGWVPDWADSDQQKWFPWFDLSSGGFVFYDTTYGCSITRAGYASRLCFKSKELAEYAGKQFTELYKGFILIQ